MKNLKNYVTESIFDIDDETITNKITYTPTKIESEDNDANVIFNHYNKKSFGELISMYRYNYFGFSETIYKQKVKYNLVDCNEDDMWTFTVHPASIDDNQIIWCIESPDGEQTIGCDINHQMTFCAAPGPEDFEDDSIYDYTEKFNIEFNKQLKNKKLNTNIMNLFK